MRGRPRRSGSTALGCLVRFGLLAGSLLTIAVVLIVAVIFSLRSDNGATADSLSAQLKQLTLPNGAVPGQVVTTRGICGGGSPLTGPSAERVVTVPMAGSDALAYFTNEAKQNGWVVSATPNPNQIVRTPLAASFHRVKGDKRYLLIGVTPTDANSSEVDVSDMASAQKAC